MALTTEELEQIRAVVRSEIELSRAKNTSGVLKSLGIFAAIFLAVLALHVIVIGGFTVYHLMTN